LIRAFAFQPNGGDDAIGRLERVIYIRKGIRQELAARNREVRVDASSLGQLEAGEEPGGAERIEAVLGTDHVIAMCDVQVTAIELRVFAPSQIRTRIKA
jgi:hypothetical protein